MMGRGCAGGVGWRECKRGGQGPTPNTSRVVDEAPSPPLPPIPLRAADWDPPVLRWCRLVVVIVSFSPLLLSRGESRPCS